MSDFLISSDYILGKNHDQLHPVIPFVILTYSEILTLKTIEPYLYGSAYQILTK